MNLLNFENLIAPHGGGAGAVLLNILNRPRRETTDASTQHTVQMHTLNRRFVVVQFRFFISLLLPASQLALDSQAARPPVHLRAVWVACSAWSNVGGCISSTRPSVTLLIGLADGGLVDEVYGTRSIVQPASQPKNVLVHRLLPWPQCSPVHAPLHHAALFYIYVLAIIISF